MSEEVLQKFALEEYDEYMKIREKLSKVEKLISEVPSF